MLAAAWAQDGRREAAWRMLQPPFCVFSGPGAGPFRPVVSGEGEGPVQARHLPGGLLPYPGVFPPTFLGP